MPPGHTHINLADIEDAAIPNGFDHRWEARLARDPLGCEETGVSHFRLKPGKRSPFVHRHQNAEEVYVVIGGGGWIKLDDEVSEVRVLDAIRVASEVGRAFEAGPDGLEFIAFGPKRPGDGEPVDDPWVE